MKVKDMKSILVSNKFDNTECNFKLKSKAPKVTLESLNKKIDDVITAMNNGFKQVNARIDRIETRLDNIEARIDRIVQLNNLKE